MNPALIALLVWSAVILALDAIGRRIQSRAMRRLARVHAIGILIAVIIFGAVTRIEVIRHG